MGALRVALLDAGAQLERVIMRRVLEQGYDVDKFRADVDPSSLKDYDAIIISGGPRSVNDPDALLPHPDVYRMGKPILGICYGLQAMTHQLGGTVVNGERGQYGRSQIQINEKGMLFHGLSDDERVLMSHFDTVDKVPDGFKVYAKSDGLVAAMGDEERKFYAVQFHPELIPVTKHGDVMFDNFFRYVCGFPEAEKRTIQQEIENAKQIITDTVGSDKRVMHYLSGGVDSTVMAILLTQCVEPDRLFMRTLDTGTMRLGEIEEVIAMAGRLGLPNFEVLRVAERFYGTMHRIKAKQGEVFAGPLWNEIDPERKRKLFGTEYAEIAIDEMRKLSAELGISISDFLLGQGTLRPDMIESGDGRATVGGAHTIKTHHNAVDALKSITKVEPLVDVFKDQVREMALALGLDEAFAFRQPFPGPGLYCRMIGMHNFNVSDAFRSLDQRVHEYASALGFDARVLPVKTVGVQGDERSYKHPVLVSGDVCEWKDFAKLALALPNDIREINRVLYSLSEPLSFEQAVSITPTSMKHIEISQLQQADKVMREIAEHYGFNDSRRCSQMPGILTPCNFGEDGKRSFVFRPVYTHDFMAIIGMMPHWDQIAVNPEEIFHENMFKELSEKIPERVEGISRVILDASDKPPGSTEWE